MKKTFYKLVILLAVFIISCNSSDNSQGQNNLLEISRKLNSLDPSVVNNNNQDPNTRKEKTNQLKKTSKTENEFCKHTITEKEFYEEVQFEFTTAYFDKNMNPITNCDLYSQESNAHYITKESYVTTGLNFKYVISSLTENIETFTEPVYLISNASKLSGELNFDGEIFYIVEGSFFNSNVTINYENANESFDESFSLMYKFEFQANSETYHFDMIVTDETSTFDDSLDLDFPLYDEANSQIGVIKYVFDYDTEREYFKLYDLKGNLIE